MEQDRSEPDVLAFIADQQLAESYEMLRGAARGAALALHYDQNAWQAVNRTLRQIASENSVDGIIARQQATMAGIYNSLGRDVPRIIDKRRPTADEMQEAEANLRKSLAEIGGKLSDIEATARQITADPEKKNAVDRIATVMSETLAELSPIGFLIVLWWLLAMMPNPELNVLAIWYVIANDWFKKKKTDEAKHLRLGGAMGIGLRFGVGPLRVYVPMPLSLSWSRLPAARNISIRVPRSKKPCRFRYYSDGNDTDFE